MIEKSMKYLGAMKGTCSNALQISSSLKWLNGSKLYRTVAENNTGSCGMIDRCDLNSWNYIILSLAYTLLPSASILAVSKKYLFCYAVCIDPVYFNASLDLGQSKQCRY